MTDLVFQSRPELRRPVLIAAFEGWSDAAEAATSAVRYLREQWKANIFAAVDAEDFFDFQAHRPLVRLNEEGVREITWPQIDFAHARIPGADRDAVLVVGIEPSMRWPTFCRLALGAANGCEFVVSLGALLAGRPHTRPIRVSGTATTPDLATKFGISTPRYEGPTALVSVLMDACRRANVEAVSLWGWVPHYLQGAPSPTAALALLQRLGTLIDAPIDLGDLEERARAHAERVSEAVRSDPDIAATVEELERQADAEDMDDIPSGDELAAEVERFLRNQRGER